MYIIIALVKVKTSNYLSKKNEIWNKARGWKKIHNPYVSFDIVTFAIYGNNNNGNMVVGEIPQFFQFPKRDISTARCKCTIYIFRYKGIKVVIRTEFIDMTVLLSMQAFFYIFLVVVFTWCWIQFFFKEIVLVIRNCCITMSEIELVFRRAEFLCSGSVYSMFFLEKNCIWFKF